MENSYFMKLSGTDFEGLVNPFFEKIFKEVGYADVGVINQKSGTQNGFDIKIVFNDENNKKRYFFVECKYYKSKLDWMQAFRKQAELNASNYEVDAFILLSPNVNLSNIDDNLQAKTTKDFFGFPAYFWTPAFGVENLFSLCPELFKKIYEKEANINIDRNSELNIFKEKINSLLKEKDEITNKLPPKKKYPSPVSVYIPRSLNEIQDGFSLKKERIKDLFLKTQKIALLGSAGTGKSIELNQLVYELSSEDTPYYPFLINLHTYTGELIKSRLPNIESIPQNKIVLCLDGLDEVLPSEFAHVGRKISAFVEDFPEAKVIVSCRENFYTTALDNQRENTLSGFKSYYLNALSMQDIVSYLDENYPLLKDSFLQEVRKNGIEDLLYIPYYLISLIEQYGDNNYIANSKTDLFENIVQKSIKEDIDRYYSEEKDRAKNELKNKMRKCLEKVAFALEYQSRNICEFGELNLHLTDDESDLIENASSLIKKEGGEQSSCRFIHRNIQEYLTAKVISKLDFSSVKEIVAFKPNFEKLKPTWVNTLSFLVSILGNDKKEDLKNNLLEWLLKDNPTSILQFEPDKIEESICDTIFRKIFTFYKEENRVINRSVINILDLSKFCIADETFHFLLRELDVKESPVSRNNALSIIYNCYQERGNKDEQQIKNLIEGNIYSSDAFVHHTAINIYVELFTLNSIEFQKLFDVFKTTDNSYAKYMLYYGIHKQDYQDKYIDFIIEKVKNYVINEQEEKELSNVYWELKKCILSVKEIKNICKLICFLMDNYEGVNKCIYLQDLIPNLLDCIIKEHPTDNKIFSKIQSAYLNDIYVSVNHGFGSPIIEYFDKTNKKLFVFRKSYQRKKEQLHQKFATWEALVNEDVLRFLAKEFLASKINKDIVETFQRYLRGDDLKFFNKLINKKESIPLPIYRDYENEKKLEDKRAKELLLNKEEFLKSLEQIFINQNKDLLTYEEVWEIQRTKYNQEKLYNYITLNSIRLVKHDQFAEKENILEYYNKNWNWYSTQELINLLKNKKDLELTSNEVACIKNLCDEKKEKVDFTKALECVENKTHMCRNAHDLAFFITRLNFKDYPEILYLDMLSFASPSINTFSFVETIIAKNKIDERVKKNLANTIECPIVLEAHLNYCVRHNIKTITKYLLPYLENPQYYYHRHAILSAYVKLEGSLSELEKMLQIVQDDFQYNIIEVLLKKNSKNIENYLCNEFINKLLEEERKLKLATYLIELQNVDAMQYYIDYIKREKIVPYESAFFNPLHKITTTSAIDLVFELYELGFDETIKQSEFNDLKSTTITILGNIGSNNFPEVFEGYERYKQKIKNSKLYQDIVTNFNYHFENIEHQYYVKKSIGFTFEDALQKYDTFV